MSLHSTVSRQATPHFCSSSSTTENTGEIAALPASEDAPSSQSTTSPKGLTPDEAVKRYGRLARPLAAEYVTPDLEIEDFEQEAMVAIIEIAGVRGAIPEMEMRSELRGRLRRKTSEGGFLARRRETASLDDEIDGDDATTLHERVGPIDRTTPEDVVAAKELLDDLPSSTRRILASRSVGDTYVEISNRRGLTEDSARKAVDAVRSAAGR